MDSGLQLVAGLFSPVAFLQPTSVFYIADCSPACQNGGTCNHSSSNVHCDCPRGYTGDYCQYRGIHCCTHHEQHRSMMNCTYTTVIHIVLQTVLSVRMEECVFADYIIPSVTVPVGTLEYSARTKVCT